MREVIAVCAGFLLITVLLNRKVDVGTTMFSASVAIGLLAGFGVPRTVRVIIASLVSPTTVELLVTITLICILGHLLFRYKVLDKMVDSLEELFRNVHMIIMLVPSIMGVLFIPGGAVLSAPVVGSLGDRMGIDGARKSAINLVFRHAWFFIFPFSTAIILASKLAQVDIYDIIRANAPMAAVAVISGYFLFIRNCESGDNAGAEFQERTAAIKLGRAVLYTSPLWVGIAFNIAFNMPFYFALIPAICIIYPLAEGDRKGFFGEALRGVKYNMLYSFAGIMVLQGFIAEISAIRRIIDIMVLSGVDARLMMMVAAFLVGLATASNPAVVGMLYPLFLPLAPDYGTTVVYASLIFVAGFLGYFVSPLHLCQIFTVEYFETGIKDIYREYRLLWPILFVATLFLFFVVY